MKHLLTPLLCTAVLALPIGSLAQSSISTPATSSLNKAADTAGSLIPADAAWSIVFDASKLGDSPLVNSFLGRLDDAQQEKLKDKVAGVSQMFGVDLQQDLGRIVAFGKNFKRGDFALAMEVGGAKTNVEGLLLAADGYDSYDYAGLIVHSFLPEKPGPRLYCAVVERDLAGSNLVVLAPQKQTTQQLIDQAQRGTPLASATALPNDDFFTLRVNSIPMELFGGNRQQSNIAGMIESFELVGSSGEQMTSLALHMQLTNEARAQQVMQLALGGKAMVEFAAADNPDAARLADLLAYVGVDHPEGTSSLIFSAFLNNGDLKVLLDKLDHAGAFDELDLD